MDADESPYHCSDCGLCRVGGTENFKHCHDCGIDIDITQFNEHSCKAGKYMSNCPICQVRFCDVFFTSLYPIKYNLFLILIKFVCLLYSSLWSIFFLFVLQHLLIPLLKFVYITGGSFLFTQGVA